MSSNAIKPMRTDLDHGQRIASMFMTQSISNMSSNAIRHLCQRAELALGQRAVPMSTTPHIKCMYSSADKPFY